MTKTNICGHDNKRKKNNKKGKLKKGAFLISELFFLLKNRKIFAKNRKCNQKSRFVLIQKNWLTRKFFDVDRLNAKIFAKNRFLTRLKKVKSKIFG